VFACGVSLWMRVISRGVGMSVRLVYMLSHASMCVYGDGGSLRGNFV
jgi:hypothetical protein